MGREHPGEEHRQLVGQHHPAVQKQATSRSSQADELLGNPRQVSFVAKAVVDVVDVAFVAVATAVAIATDSATAGAAAATVTATATSVCADCY